MEILKDIASKFSNLVKNIFSKKPQNQGQEYINKSINRITNSPNATINQNVQFGTNIHCSKEQPTNMNAGDYWFQIMEDEKGKK